MTSVQGGVLRTRRRTLVRRSEVLDREAFDIDGNVVRQSRRLTASYDITPGWSALDELEDPVALDAHFGTVQRVGSRRVGTPS